MLKFCTETFFFLGKRLLKGIDRWQKGGFGAGAHLRYNTLKSPHEHLHFKKILS